MVELFDVETPEMWFPASTHGAVYLRAEDAALRR